MREKADRAELGPWQRPVEETTGACASRTMPVSAPCAPSPLHASRGCSSAATTRASAAANLFSLVASCKLHGLDPEVYLEHLVRVMPYWPRDRYLELAPKYWSRTRARLDPCQLDRPLGYVTVPSPLSAEEQRATS
jgi:hypothetical protein